jgi:predicted AAA+ superfamily ATPase
MGKSSLVKAVHAEINRSRSGNTAPHAEIDRTRSGDARPLKLIEIHREDVETLPELMALLRADSHRFVVFCDDLSFDADDTSYKSLKAVLEGGIEGRPDNVIFYATSNRRHLLPRDMMENERSTAINPGEAVEEKVSLSDRFGLWLGFHKCSQDEYLDMVYAYVEHLGLKADRQTIRAEALEWSTTRGARSGRTAWQYIQDLAGRLEQRIEG